ncbi:MAG: hemolysin III family protein [Phycisphaerales bacterium]
MAVQTIPGFYEPVSALTHLLGAGVFLALGVPLVRRFRATPGIAVALGVYVFALVFMLSMSGVYHTLDEESLGGRVFHRLDKAAIFVMIAGTFTPVHAMLFRGHVRWAGLAAKWAMAITGLTLMTVFFDRMPRGLGTTLYITLGWIAGLTMIAAWRRDGFRTVRGFVIGGVAYSVGAVMMGIGWPTVWPGVIDSHEVWHVAVLLGMTLHWRFIVGLAERTVAAMTAGPAAAAATGG